MSEYQSGGGDKSNELKIFPLRNEDLVFSKNRDGVLSCGYKVSNALLNATLGMPMSGGGGGKDTKKEQGKHKANEHEIKSAKIMEDLVVPSSLYYGKPVNNHKVFNYKKGKRDRGNKSRDASSDNDSDDNVIEESLYDKLLSLVTADNKIKYDKKTRKVIDKDKHEKRVKGDSVENTKIKIKNKKTRRSQRN
jgi:hypothetical protein